MLFLSLLINIMSYAAVSVSFKGNRERNYAEMFVDIDKYITNHENAFVWKGTAYISIFKSVAALSWRRPNKTSFDYFQFKIQHR
jgi:hypothetical protein